MDFSEIFQKLRSEAGLKQDEMAKKLGVSKSTIGMWETGKRLPSPELYEQVADYFNVDIDYLYGRSSVRQRIHYDKDGTAYVPADNITSDAVIGLRVDEHQLLGYYNQLNDVGKTKAMSDISDMTELPKYTSGLTIAAHHNSGNFTDEQNEKIREFMKLATKDNE